MQPSRSNVDVEVTTTVLEVPRKTVEQLLPGGLEILVTTSAEGKKPTLDVTIIWAPEI